MGFKIKQRQAFQPAKGLLGTWEVLGRTIRIHMNCPQHAPGPDVALTPQGIRVKRATVSMTPAWADLSSWEQTAFERDVWQAVRTKILDIRHMMLTMEWKERRRGVCQH